MSNLFINWWQSLQQTLLRDQLRKAIQQGNTRLAKKLLQEIENSGAKPSLLEKLFKNKLESEQLIQQYKKEVVILGGNLTQALEKIEALEQTIGFQQNTHSKLTPESQFIDFVINCFKLIEQDENKLQCTGIDEQVFDDFEASLVEYLKLEIAKIPSDKVKPALKEAQNDIDRLKSYKDPKYSFSLTPHVYFMRYFLENVYGSYIAWFLIYKAGLLSTKINILDIGSGPGTVAYGLALLLKSTSYFFPMPSMHISYYSLEQQASLQYRGLQLWRRYIEPQQAAINAYFRFDTFDFLDYCNQPKKLPNNFFDFIVISHCFFADGDKRIKSYEVFNEVFSKCLKKEGYVVLIIQGRKLFKAYNLPPSEDGNEEQTVVRRFIEEMGLNLIWYKYITSTGIRTPMSCEKFAIFAEKNLPLQKHMSKLARQHLGRRYDSRYTLDDYIILAKK